MSWEISELEKLVEWNGVLVAMFVALERGSQKPSDLKWGKFRETTEQNWAAAHKALLELKLRDRWIPCEEKLPDDGASVWINWMNRDRPCGDEAQYQADNESFTLARTDGRADPIIMHPGEVTHWRLLPSPPIAKQVAGA